MIRIAALLVLLAAAGCGKKDRDRGREQTEPAPPGATASAARTAPRAARPPTDPRVDAIARCWAGVDAGKTDGGCYRDGTLPPRAPFPDLQHQLGLILVGGDQAVITFAAHGTNRGAFHGRPPSYHMIGLLGAQHLRLAGTRIEGADTYLDLHSMLGQLGMLPPDASYRAAAQKGGQGQTRAVVARDDADEKAHLAAVEAIEAALARSAIDEALATFAPEARFLYVPGAADAAGTTAVRKQLTAWRARAAAPPAVQWTLAAGEHVAVGTQAGDDGARELHLYQFDGGKVGELWIYGAGPAATAPPAHRPPAP